MCWNLCIIALKSSINVSHDIFESFVIKFASTSELSSTAMERTIRTTVFAPETGAVGNLFRVDALEIREGFYAGNFVGPQQIRKGGEISWDVID